MPLLKFRFVAVMDNNLKKIFYKFSNFLLPVPSLKLSYLLSFYQGLLLSCFPLTWACSSNRDWGKGSADRLTCLVRNRLTSFVIFLVSGALPLQQKFTATEDTHLLGSVKLLQSFIRPNFLNHFHLELPDHILPCTHRCNTQEWPEHLSTSLLTWIKPDNVRLLILMSWQMRCTQLRK